MMIIRNFLLGLAATVGLAACTSAPIDQSVAAKIKSVTVTKMYLPEYTYAGRDNEALAFAGASAVGAYAFGVFGVVAADIAKNRAETPYRQAIKSALSDSGPSFAEVVDLKIADNLAARGIRANFISAPPKASDNSGYEFANADIADQYALELLPFAVGFAQEPQSSTPLVDVRWRLLERYPNGRLIEVARGSVVYSHYSALAGKNAVKLPADLAHKFPVKVLDLPRHGPGPAQAMRDIAAALADSVVDQAIPRFK